MNKIEATALLLGELQNLRGKSYTELIQKIHKPESYEVMAASKTRYQVELQVFWEEKPSGDIRVMASIDKGALKAFVPLTKSFVMTSAGNLIEEEEG